jgi:hypothetical protein
MTTACELCAAPVRHGIIDINVGQRKSHDFSEACPSVDQQRRDPSKVIVNLAACRIERHQFF